MNETPNLHLPYLLAAQAQKHVTHNEAIRALDCVVQLSVLDRNLAAPPVAPSDGDRYIVDSSPTGDWAGRAGSIAAFQDGTWLFYVPREGWIAWVADEDALVAFDGSAWTGFSGGGGGGGVTDHGALTGLADDDHPHYLNEARGDARYAPVNPAVFGINATADATNRIAVASAASLFNHAGGGHQVKINKNAPAETASVLFQTGFSGRAEFGTAGNDDFHVKVSADGVAWNEAIVIDRATGACAFPNTSLGGGSGGGAPVTADYLVRTANAGLSSERVVADSDSVVADWSVGGAVRFDVPGYAGLRSSFAYTSMQLAKVLNAAHFPSADAIADHFDDLSYVDTGGAANLDSATAGILKPAGSMTTQTLLTPASTSGVGGYTVIDRVHQLTAGDVINEIGIYSTTPRSGAKGKIVKRNGTSNYDIVAETAAFDHTGSGWEFSPLTSSCAVPGTGTYYAGSYIPTGSGVDVSANIARAYIAGDPTGTGVGGWSENTNTCMPVALKKNSAFASLAVPSTALPFAAEPAVMSGRLLVREVASVVPNTDFFMEFSRDNGATWATATLSLARSIPDPQGTLRLYDTGEVDVTGQTYAAPRYRIRTANAKNLEIHAVFVEGA